MSPFAVLAGVCWVLLIVVDVILIALAFQSGAGMGLTTLIMPFYAVTTGNWRLRTERRKMWALTWWVLFGAAVLSFVLAR